MKVSISPAIFALCGASTALAATTVVVNGTASHSIPATLYGQIFEDINSGDGGLYAELLQNRAFQQVNVTNQTAALYAWQPIGSANLQVIADSEPVSAALPNSLQLTVPANASGTVGFSNSGYFGINVNSSWAYNASLYYRFPSSSSFTGNITVGLQSSSGSVVAANTISLDGSQTNWTQLTTVLKPSTSAPDDNNLFTVTLNASGSAETINFALFSLFPPTFNNRPNGLRIDIAEILAEMDPGFFRFPGGNNLGQTIATRWQWNATVGPLLNRPGRVGDWGYINTDGLGLLEFLQFIEDLDMEPVMAVYSGYSLGGESVAEADLGPYIQQAIDQINFAIGDPNASAPAALRASLGHPEPFALTYIEVGNEDFFAANTYPYRWSAFYGNLSAAFPQLQYIATTHPFDPILSPTAKLYDNHVYSNPDYFIQNAFYYDQYERNGTLYMEGEYAADVTNNGTGLAFPTVQSAIAEAAYITGLERNSDIVFASCYAPLLQNVNGSEAPPDLVSFDASSVIRSTSFYVQKLFSLSKGNQYLPSTLPTVNGTLYWSTTQSNSTGDVYIKVVNTANASADVVFKLPFSSVASTGTVQVLQGAPDDSNTAEAPDTAVPTTSSITTGSTLNYTAPAYSLSVITVGTSD